MARGDWVSPWQMTVADYKGRKITVEITFNPSTLAIINPGLTGFRDPACSYDRVLIGRTTGGRPQFRIPDGAFTVTRTQLSAQGFNTIQQVVDANITFGSTQDL